MELQHQRVFDDEVLSDDDIPATYAYFDGMDGHSVLCEANMPADDGAPDLYGYCLTVLDGQTLPW